MTSAHDRAVRRAKRWAKRHGYEWPLRRLPSGETAHRERSEWIGDGHGRILSVDESTELERGSDIRPLIQQRTVRQRALAAFFDRIFEHLRPQDQELLRERFYEGATLEGMAAHRRVSYQAIQGQLSTAINNLKRAVAEHGHELEAIAPDEL